MSKHILENEYLKVTIDDKGAELISVYDKENGIERMWNANPNVWNRHAPFLFPFVGRVVGGVYRHEGKEYEMKTQHGFARDREFMCVYDDGSCVVHTLSSDDATLAIYPFEFDLHIIHSFCEDNPRQIEIKWEVKNKGNQTMYYAIGGHPGFALDIRDVTKREAYYMGLPSKGKLQYVLVNPDTGFVIPDKKYDLELEDGVLPISKNMFDNDALIFEDGQLDKVEILKPDKSKWVSVDIEGFPYVAIWSKPVGDFICIEPWYGRTDDDGYTGELKDKPGEMSLEAYKKTVFSYKVEFHI